MASLPRRLVAEALGTFGLVFIGTAAVIVNGFPNASFGVMGVAVAHAFVLSIMVTITMNISGGHLNPAVTLSLAMGKRISAQEAAFYWVAQLAGAVLASLLVQAILPSGVSRVTALGTPGIAHSLTLAQAIWIEAVLTFFLVSAVYGTIISTDAPKVGGFGVGLVLLFAVLVGGPLTGASLNPARAFGPALISGTWVGHLAYWVGPMLGAVVANVLWERVLLPRSSS